MPDSTPVASAVIAPGSVTAIPEVITPAVPAPKPTIANPDTILANIKARIAAAKPVDTGHPGTAPTQPGTGAVPDIQPDAKATLAELSKVQAKAREYAERVKVLEAQAQDAELGKSIKGAKSPKEQLEAVAKMAGKDPTEYLADLVSLYFEQPGTGDKPAGAEPTGEFKAVLDRMEAMAKQLEELKGGKAQDGESIAKAQAAQQEAGTKAYLKAIAEKHKDKFEISSRPENLEEAISKALAKAPEALVKLGFDPANLTEEQAEALAQEAFSQTELEFEQLGKRFGKVTKPARTRAYDLPLSKPRIDFGKKPDKETFDQLKERYRAKYADHFSTGTTYQSTPNGQGAGIVK